MKAVVVHEYGGPEVLKFEEYPDPAPGPGEVWCGSPQRA
jgi:NADPH2:quinone reductase